MHSWNAVLSLSKIQGSNLVERYLAGFDCQGKSRIDCTTWNRRWPISSTSSRPCCSTSKINCRSKRRSTGAPTVNCTAPLPNCPKPSRTVGPKTVRIFFEKMNYHARFIDNITVNLLKKCKRILVKFVKIWSCGGSNPGPFTCKANALPLSYNPLFYTLLTLY